MIRTTAKTNDTNLTMQTKSNCLRIILNSTVSSSSKKENCKIE